MNEQMRDFLFLALQLRLLKYHGKLEMLNGSKKHPQDIKYSIFYFCLSKIEKAEDCILRRIIEFALRPE